MQLSKKEKSFASGSGKGNVVTESGVVESNCLTRVVVPHRLQTVQHKISDCVCDVHLSTFAFATTKSFAGGSRKGNVVTESGVLALRSSEELGDGQHIEEVLISLSVK